MPQGGSTVSEYVNIGQPNSPLRAILEVEDDTRVVAVLRPNGSVMEYRDIPRWVFMDIRHRGMVYVGGALSETQIPQQNPVAPSSDSQGTSHNRCKPVWAVAAAIGVLFVIYGIMNPDAFESDVPASSSPTATPTPTPPTYVHPQTILSTFRENPARGKVEYMREPIHVRGNVRSFNNSDSRVIYLTPEATWETGDYEVFLVRLPNLDTAASLSIGDELRMLCKIGLGNAFPHGYEVECIPDGPIIGPRQNIPTSTPRPTLNSSSPSKPIQTSKPTPTSTATPTPLPPATVTAIAEAIAATATAQPTPTSTPTPVPTFEERRAAVVDQYCGGSNYAQACVDKVGSDYCVEFYENPTHYYDRYGVCTYFGF